MPTKTTTKTTKSKAPQAAQSTKAAVVAAKDAGTRTGVVESDKRSKTRKVVLNYLAKHPKYGKYIRQRTVLQVHDEANSSKLGDVVEVAPCRPVSSTKFWTLVRVVERRGDVTAALASAKELGQ